MHDALLGQTPDSTAERDAIHVAVVAMIAAVDLEPGQRVSFAENGGASHATSGGLTIGIVDPFLHGTVRKGDRFWMLLLPGTVTGMRHHWTPPQFLAREPGATETDEGKATAIAIAAICGKTYNALMEDAAEFAGDGSSGWNEWITDNSERYKDVPGEMWKKFWAYYERTTGNPAPHDKWAPYICSC